VPVTAKLSREFYEKFGDKIADELVNWFNQVDATYRSDLKDLNELNFTRFDARVGQRFAESDARLERRFAELDVRLEQRFAELDVRHEKRFAESDAKWERRLAQFDVKWEHRFSELDVKWERRMATWDVRVTELKTSLIKWMFVFWVGTAVTLLGTTIAIIKL